MKFLDEPHYYPTNVELDIDKDYILHYISILEDKDWINHKSTKSNRQTEIWYSPVIRPEKFKYQPDDYWGYKFPTRNPKWEVEKNTKLPRTDYSILILKINANDRMPPHTDGFTNPRRTCWNFPLSGDYAPVTFYDNFDEPAVDSYTGQMLLNTANIHEVDNGPETRYNLQICFEDDIETIYQLHKDIMRD